MFRTAFSIAAVGLCIWLAIRLVFGVAGGVIGLLLTIAWLALKVVLVVGLVYWLLTVFSPDTAKKMKDAMRGETL
jgi:uncharacterized membrane protein